MSRRFAGPDFHTNEWIAFLAHPETRGGNFDNENFIKPDVPGEISLETTIALGNAKLADTCPPLKVNSSGIIALSGTELTHTCYMLSHRNLFTKFVFKFHKHGTG